MSKKTDDLNSSLQSDETDTFEWPDEKADQPGYHEALELIAKKQLRQLPFITGLTIVLGILLFGLSVLIARVPSSLIPVLYCAGGGIVLFLLWAFLSSRRCPQCRRFFARGSLEPEGSYTTTQPVNMTAQRTSTVRVFRTLCRHCGHEWRVLR
ncbi:hypothetical protein DRQ25_16055 [Candidatus Fermentibacteria bacterium]|nr:MAG: hypothetical protein DRQ25_16055 [Candidatus Fermentibacteria bacterium]